MRKTAPEIALDSASPPARRRDPRHYQIAVLTALLVYGVAALDLEVDPVNAVAILATALFVQFLGGRLTGAPRFDPKSPLISALSLCLLLRTGSPFLAAAAAAIAIGGKFAIRVRGKHVFNPSNLGLVAMMLLSDRVWASPGQWGSAALAALALAGLGGLVVRRAARSDVTWAFLAFWVAIVVGRAGWLGDPLSIPLRQLQSGALLIFAFFMISDPKTTPDSRAGRVLFAALVAAGAGWVQFGLFRTNGLLWALAAAAPLVPLIDLLLPAGRYRWDRPGTGGPLARSSRIPARKEPVMNRPTVPAIPAILVAVAFAAALAPRSAAAFCGFYVARADTQLYNHASQVALVRDDDRTVLTMANDFKGDPQEFALVVPVPTFLEREQIHVADKALVDHLDAYTAPRLVEYFDPDPCAVYESELFARKAQAPASAGAEDAAGRAKALGVTIEAAYTVGEYDILILSAKQSDGLVTWLKENGYKIPSGAEAVVASYLRQGMRFFVAKVNLGEQAKLGFHYLRPLQVAYESPKFMLPIRLGTVNADGAQELFIYTLTRTGRVETTNYRTVRLPTGDEVPLFVKDDFSRFYQDMFSRQVDRESMKAVFLEYAWDMAWCDPCAADPLSAAELRELGVFWLDDGGAGPVPVRAPVPPGGGAQNVFVTRLHVRYDRDHFPEDLFFQETGDRQNFQGRYVLRHPWKGNATCEAAQRYRLDLRERHQREAATLASLTGWDIDDIRRRMKLPATDPAGPEDQRPWWKRIWGDG